MISRLLIAAMFTALLLFSMSACDKGKGTDKAEDTTWTWDKCTTEGWDTIGQYFHSCDTLAFDWFADDCEWDSITDREYTRDYALRSSELYLLGAKRLSPRISALHWIQRITIQSSHHLEELPSEIWAINRLDAIVIENVPTLKIIHDLPGPSHASRITIDKSNPQLPKNLNLAPIDQFHWEMVNQNITEIPEELRNLTSVTDLTLQHGNFIEIPVWITELTSLYGLSFTGAPLKVFPELVLSLPHLKRVLLGNSNFSSIPASVCERPDIELGLIPNRICSRDSIPSCFDSTKTATILKYQICN